MNLNRLPKHRQKNEKHISKNCLKIKHSHQNDQLEDTENTTTNEFSVTIDMIKNNTAQIKKLRNSWSGWNSKMNTQVLWRKWAEEQCTFFEK